MVNAILKFIDFSNSLPIFKHFLYIYFKTKVKLKVLKLKEFCKSLLSNKFNT